MTVEHSHGIVVRELLTLSEGGDCVAFVDVARDWLCFESAGG